MTGRPRRRIHDCRHDTPLIVDYTKIPSSAECEEPDCYWQRYAPDSSPAALEAVRSLATHHAKALRHSVLVHLAQQVRLTPKEGAPLGAGAAPSIRPRADAEAACE
jgi:hypothetical protein